MMRSITGAIAAVALVAADTPAPAQFAGTWTGSVSQGFASASPTDAGALQCFGNGGVMSAPITATLSTTMVEESSAPQETATFSNTPYTLAARDNTTYYIASFTPSANVTVAGMTGGMLLLRQGAADAAVQCKYALINSTNLYVVTLGGDAYSIVDQCDEASYKSVAVLTTPFCTVLNGTQSPFASSVVESYTMEGATGNGGNGDNNGGNGDNNGGSTSDAATAGVSALLLALAAAGVAYNM